MAEPIVSGKVTIYAQKDHLIADINMGKLGNVGLRFNSPEEILMFFTLLIEKAGEVWPNNEYIKEYLSDD